MEDPSSALSTSSIVLAVVLGGVLLMWVQHVYSLHKCGTSIPGALLPKGSLGWPIIGESIAFARDPKAFAQSRVQRHGNTFKSSLFLRRLIVGTTPEFYKFIFTNTKLFRRHFPDVLQKLAGANTFVVFDGPKHSCVKKVVIKALGPDGLRTQVQAFESIILESMASWARTGTFVAKNAMQELTWDTSNWILFGDSRSRSTPEGKAIFENFNQLMRTTASIPVNLPGTTYSKGLKAKATLVEVLRKAIQRAKAQKKADGAVFGAMMAAVDDPEAQEELKNIDDHTMAQNLLWLNFAAYETTATSLVWILKFLVDFPDVFRRIQAEQEEILKDRDRSVEGPRLTWEDTRKMVYTHKFFQEVQRYTSLIPVAFKEATEDVKFGDHIIPKGWIVMAMSNIIHSDPANYPDLSFNPDRFDVNPKPYTYLPFSAGAHMCQGIEMAKLIVFIFVHHITTTYSYETAAPDQGVEYNGVAITPKGGYPISLHPRK